MNDFGCKSLHTDNFIIDIAILGVVEALEVLQVPSDGGSSSLACITACVGARNTP